MRDNAGAYTTNEITKYQQRRRVVRCVIPKTKAEYKTIAEKRWATVGKVLGVQAHRLRCRAKAIGRSGSERQCRKLEKRMNKFMRALTKELLTIEDKMVASGAGNKKKGNTD